MNRLQTEETVETIACLRVLNCNLSTTNSLQLRHKTDCLKTKHSLIDVVYFNKSKCHQKQHSPLSVFVALNVSCGVYALKKQTVASGSKLCVCESAMVASSSTWCPDARLSSVLGDMDQTRQCAMLIVTTTVSLLGIRRKRHVYNKESKTEPEAVVSRLYMTGSTQPVCKSVCMTGF